MFELKFKGAKGETSIDIGKHIEILKHTAEGKWISTYGFCGVQMNRLLLNTGNYFF